MSRVSEYTVACPHCGLILTIKGGTAGPAALCYDAEQWRRRCKRPEGRSPAFCLSERGMDDSQGQ